MPPDTLSPREFIALMALMVSMTAFSIDAMLPALTIIGGELSPEAPNNAQLVVTVFVLGMGLGTAFVGVLADAFGRRAVILWGIALYVLAAVAGWFAPTMETLLAARFLQGTAAAVPRIAGTAMIRDLYAGRRMARMLSFVFMVFTLVPVLAPALGAGLIALFGWRSVFPAFVVFGLVAGLWFALRQRETLPPAHRRPLAPGVLAEGVRTILGQRLVLRAIVAQTFVFGILFGTLASSQPIFDQAFGRADSFAYWFGAVAMISASGSFINAQIVERLGMRFLVSRACLTLAALAALFLAGETSGLLGGDRLFAAYVVLMVGVFTAIGLCIGNLNALGMEPVAHLAGLAASVIGAIATIGGGLLGTLVALMFDGTPVPTAALVMLYALAVVAVLRGLGDGPAIPVRAAR